MLFNIPKALAGAQL